MVDVRVGEQEIARLGQNLGGLRHSLRQRPHLAGPTRGQWFAVNDMQAIIALRGGSRGINGAVAAAVVDHDQGNVARIVLGQQGGDSPANDRRLVPCRHHHHGAGPVIVVCRWRLQAPVGAPEASVEKHQIEPHRQGHGGKNVKNFHYRRVRKTAA